MNKPLPPAKYGIILADPPWPYYGSGTKNAAAAKHYDLMTLDDICRLPVREISADLSACFMWATCPKLDMAIHTLVEWGFFYRGVAFVWVKTRKDGGIIGAQGIPATFTKPTTELVLLGTKGRTGRPHDLLDASVPQVQLAPRGRHSEKPECIRDAIDTIYSKSIPRIELFARKRVPGWDAWGNEV